MAWFHMRKHDHGFFIPNGNLKSAERGIIVTGTMVKILPGLFI